jgi:hypothetical protein
VLYCFLGGLFLTWKWRSLNSGLMVWFDFVWRLKWSISCTDFPKSSKHPQLCRFWENPCGIFPRDINYPKVLKRVFSLTSRLAVSASSFVASTPLPLYVAFYSMRWQINYWNWQNEKSNYQFQAADSTDWRVGRLPVSCIRSFFLFSFSISRNFFF